MSQNTNIEIDGFVLSEALSSGRFENSFQANFKSDSKRLKISNITVTSDIQKKKIAYNANLKLENCIFEKNAEFVIEPSSSSFVFSQCKFNANSAFKGGKDNVLNFSECYFHQMFVIDGQFNFIGLYESTGKCSFHRIKFNNLVLGNYISPKFNHLEHVDFGFGNNQGAVQIIRSKIGTLNLAGALEKDSSIIINDIEVKHFNIKHFYVQGVFRMSHVKAVSFEEYGTEFGGFEHTEEQKQKINFHFQKTRLLIYNSDFGKSHFNSIDLRSFYIVNIAESNVFEVNFVDTIWPKKIYSFPAILEKEFADNVLRIDTLNQKDYSSIREIYRQLKLTSYKQSDFVSEQFFHGLEMTNYYKALSWQHNFWIKLIIRLSFITSNYGQSVLRPIICLIIAYILLLLTFLLLLNHQFQSCYFASLTDFGGLLAEFLRLSNPLHKNLCDVNGWAFTLDTFMRIFSSYMIYNLVRATRRFVR